MTRVSLFLPALTVAAVAGAAAAADGEHVVVTNETIRWEPAKPLPAGAEWTVLSGNPAEAGPFAIRIRFPAGYEVPAHWHSAAENVTVLSGTLGLGMGETADRSKVQPLKAGGYFAMPAKMPHYAVVTEDAVIQVNGVGPFDLNYVNPSEDPRAQVGSSQ